MFRGTTPTLNFTLPFETDTISKLCLAFAQNGKVVFEKSKEDFTLDGKNLTVKLTERETLQFDAKEPWVEMQFKFVVGEDVLASKIYKLELWRVLSEGILSDEN